MQRALNFFKARFPSGEINPVVVKEMRQSVRNWSVTGMLILFLTVLFIAMMIFLLGQSITGNATQGLGREILQMFLPILTFFSTVFIPIYVGVRLAVERQAHNIDLLYITTLPPARIIRGKLYCGIYLTVLFYAVAMPFLVLTNLLRGVDLPSIFFVLAMTFLGVVAAIQAAIFVACLPVTKGFKILLTVPAVFFGLFGAGAIGVAAFGIIQSGVGARIGSWGFWSEVLTGFAMCLSVFGLVHLLSIAMISPPTANRALPIRIYVAVIWLVTGIIAGAWFWFEGDNDFVEAWMSVFFCITLVGMLIAVSEGDELSIRVRRTIPENPFKQVIAFVFYSGAAGGLVWIIGMSVLTVLGGWAMVELIPEYSTSAATRMGRFNPDLLPFTITLYLYALAYCLFGLLIHRRWFSHRPGIFAGMFALLLPALWVIIPNLVLFFANRFSWEAMGRKQLGNPMNLASRNAITFLDAHLLCAAIMVFVAGILVLPWFIRRVKAFKPYRREDEA